MAGAGALLEDNDLDILETWIGTGPKQFTLAYKITRDGCDAPTFHQKCDNQGPTVTVLYNTHGTVYGGYSKQSWNSSGSNINDPHAFMFQLNNYGPRFGDGCDLYAFHGSITNSGGTFSLNGGMNINSTYDVQGLTKDQINNNSFVVTDLEVYKVTDGARAKPKPVQKGPWRVVPDMTVQSVGELQECLVNYKPISAPRVPQARILMVGPVGAGKSSFYNTINSVFRDRITHKAISGSSDSSLTNVLTHYQVRTVSNAKLNLRLCDTRGLEESQGTDVTEFCYLLDGNIPEFYVFNADSPIKADQMVRNTTLADKIHCVLFVLDSTTLDVMPSGILQKIKHFQKQIISRGLPQLVLLTKVDNLCESVKEYAGNIYKSETVEKAVNKTAEVFRIPRGNVLPVRNYENEGLLDTSISVSALFALQQILNFADDFLEYQLDRAAVEERGVQRLDIKD